MTDLHAHPAIVDAVIIGAGVAGLHAATLGQKAGLSVVVVEGRDRTGGRLLSLPAASESHANAARLDLGATWFWSNETRINALIAGEELRPFEQHLAGDTMFQTPDTVRRIEGNQIDAPSGRLTGGMQGVTDALERHLSPGTVYLGQAVTAINPAIDSDLLEVSAPMGVLQARHVIVAAPPALAVHAIDFNGLLEDNVAALASATPVWMGGTTKVVVEYEHAFWRDAGLAGAGFSHVGPMGEIHDMSGPDGTPAALFGFAQMGTAPAPERDDVIKQLVALFGPKAAVPLALHICDWRAEALTSPPNAAMLTNYNTYGHPLFQMPSAQGRIHWASTETATDAPGHIEGALAASARAMAAIAQACV